MDARTCSARLLWVLIEGLPMGSKTLSGLEHEWHTEHELLASLLEVSTNRGLKKSKWLHIPRPKPDRTALATTRAQVVDRMIAMGRKIGGASDG